MSFPKAGDKAQVMAHPSWCAKHCTDVVTTRKHSGMYLDCELVSVDRQSVSARITTTCQATREMGIANRKVDALPLRLVRIRPTPPYKRVQGKRKCTRETFQINDAIDLTEFLGDRASPSGQHSAPKIRHIIRMALGSVPADVGFYGHWDQQSEQLRTDTRQERTEDYITFKVIDAQEGPRRLEYDVRDKRLRERFGMFLNVHHDNEVYRAVRANVARDVAQIDGRIAFAKRQPASHEQEQTISHLTRQKMNTQLQASESLPNIKAQREQHAETLAAHLREHELLPAYQPPRAGTPVLSSSRCSSAITITSAGSYNTATWNAPRDGPHRFQVYDYVRFKDEKERWGRVLPAKLGRAPLSSGVYELLMSSSAKMERGVHGSRLEIFSENERCRNMCHLHHELKRDVGRVEKFEIETAEEYFKFHRYDMERLAFLGGVVDDFAVGSVLKIANVRMPLSPQHLQQIAQYSYGYHQAIQPPEWKSVEHSWKKWYGQTAKDLIKYGFPYTEHNAFNVPTETTTSAQRVMHNVLDFNVVNGTLSQGQDGTWEYKLTIRVRLPVAEKEALEEYQKTCSKEEIPYFLCGRVYSCMMSEWQNGRIQKFQEINGDAKAVGARTAPLPKTYAEEWANNERRNLLDVLQTRARHTPIPQPTARTAQPTAPAGIPAGEGTPRGAYTSMIMTMNSVTDTPRRSTHLEVPGSIHATPRMNAPSPRMSPRYAPPSPSNSFVFAPIVPTGVQTPLTFVPPPPHGFHSRPPTPTKQHKATPFYEVGDRVYMIADSQAGVPHRISGINGLGPDGRYTYTIQNLWATNMYFQGVAEFSLLKAVGTPMPAAAASTMVTPRDSAFTTPRMAAPTPPTIHQPHGIYMGLPGGVPGSFCYPNQLSVTPASTTGLVSPSPSASPHTVPAYIPGFPPSPQFPARHSPVPDPNLAPPGARTLAYGQDKDEIVINMDEDPELAALEMPSCKRETSAPDRTKYQNDTIPCLGIDTPLARATKKPGLPRETSAHAGDESEGEEAATLTPCSPIAG